uniref:Carboxylic ester hydrolase n=1 Tax=Laodelphax striatellus TaxID=195883 RepID=K4K2L3_LAOST|nr:carboxylesterase [Laodelphax striatellus]
MAPERHEGWDRVLFAGSFAPACSQPVQQLMPNLAPVSQQDEDCLYLNIWTTEIALNYRNAPVVVFLEGEGFISGSPNRFPGQDLAAEGVVVVSVGYRMNVFGFLCLEDTEVRGNMGLLDQYLAMLWVRENIDKFGGDHRSVTLMGHSAGAASVLFHMISPRTTGLFHRAILMSGSITSPWAHSQNPSNASRAIARSLGCHTTNNSKVIVACLRNKSTSEILRAYEAQYMNGNWSVLALPVVDSFLPEIEQYLPKEPEEALRSGLFLKVPILTGITSHEGSIAVSQLGDLLSQGFLQMRQFILSSVIPSILNRYGFTNHHTFPTIVALLEWQYVDSAPHGDSSALLTHLLDMYSDAQFKAPHEKQLKLLSHSSSDQVNFVYAYRFEQQGVDMYAKTLNVTGSAHGTELLFLFGPTLMQQVMGRRFTPTEDRLSTGMKRLWSEFIRQGNLSPSPYGYGVTWRRYTPEEGNYIILKTDSTQPPQQPVLWAPSSNANAKYQIRLWNDLLPKFRNVSNAFALKNFRTNITGLNLSNDQPYRNAMYTLIAFVIVLLILLIVCVVLLKRRAKERERDLF